jgi:hypothetical protein
MAWEVFGSNPTQKWSVFAPFWDATPCGDDGRSLCFPRGKHCDLTEFPSKNKERNRAKFDEIFLRPVELQVKEMTPNCQISLEKKHRSTTPQALLFTMHGGFIKGTSPLPLLKLERRR